jgi:Protein of unknown function (DUF433)
MRTKSKPRRVELGKYIVADPEVCHGKPTFKGTRIMVWQVFEHLALGEPLENFPKHGDGSCASKSAYGTLMNREYAAGFGPES